MNLPALRPELPARAPHLPPIPAGEARRLLPAVRSSVALVAAGLAAEFALRTLSNRALAAVTRAVQPAQPLADAAGRVSRTIVTEMVVQERFHRPH